MYTHAYVCARVCVCVYIYVTRGGKFIVLARRNEMQSIYFIFTRIYAHKITDIRKLNQVPWVYAKVELKMNVKRNAVHVRSMSFKVIRIR